MSERSCPTQQSPAESDEVAMDLTVPKGGQVDVKPVLHQCSVCAFGTTDLNELKLHLLEFHSAPPLLSNDNLFPNRESPQNGEIVCTICNQACVDVPSLQAHILVVHSELLYQPPSFSWNMLNSLTDFSGIPQPPSLPPPTSRQPRQSRPKEAFCEICQKAFCNKYFLRTHKQNKHGIPPETTMAQQAAIDLRESIETMTQSPTSLFNQTNQLALTDGAVGQQTEESTNSTSLDHTAFCELCRKEFCSKYFLKTHRRNVHGIDDDPPTFVPRVGLTARMEDDAPTLVPKEVMPSQLMSQTDVNVPEALTMTANANSLYFGNSSYKSPTSGPTAGTPGKNYCRICDKELCNKYFLRTHLQRMHGITLPMERNKRSPGKLTQAVIEEVSHKCQDCGSFWPNEPALIDHRTEYHMTSMYRCQFCHADFKSADWLASHLWNAHRFDKTIKEQSVEPTVEQTNRIGSSSSVHSRDSGVQSTDTAHPSPAQTSPRASAGTRMYSCSYCPYTTRWLSNLCVHEKRHANRSGIASGTFTCQICLRSYRYQHSLQRHMKIHKCVAAFHNLQVQRSNTESERQYYRCVFCAKSFRSAALYRAHAQNEHANADPMTPNRRLSKQAASARKSGQKYRASPFAALKSAQKETQRRQEITESARKALDFEPNTSQSDLTNLVVSSVNCTEIPDLQRYLPESLRVHMTKPLNGPIIATLVIQPSIY